MSDIDKALAYVREMIECSDDLDGHDDCEDLRRVETLLMKQERMERTDYQKRVGAWTKACFGPAADNATERINRFLEEALELVQAAGCSQDEAHQLVDYVFGRPVGETTKEAGAVMLTLAAFCNAYAIDMLESAETELGRVWHIIEAIRAKHLSKPKGSPLPQSGEGGAATFTLPPDAKVSLSSGDLPSIACEPGARRLSVPNGSPEVEWSEPENLELVLDEDGVKRWMLSTRDGQVRVGRDGCILEMHAEHYKAGTKICLKEPLEDLRDGQPIGEKKTKADGLSFEEWGKKLDAAHQRLRETKEGFEGYGAGSLVALTGKTCWQDYYNDGFSPADALDEDLSYWDGD